MTEKAVEARIVGKVQGVWFRAWTQKEAERIGVRGWVRNCEDGSVEALFAGPAEGVEAMIESCRSGPPDARVDDIQIREADDAPQGNEFRIRR